MKGLISVIVPVYNVKKYLPRCADSIINQTYKKLQIILVDDGSTDGSGNICDEYAKKDKRVQVIHKSNGGLSDARNAGIENAEGEYLAFVDSDDYIAPNMLEKLYTALQNADADMSLCSFKHVWEDMPPDGEILAKPSPIRNELLTGKDILCEKILRTGERYWVTAWNKLYKKELFDDIRYPAGKLHEDEFVLHKLLYKCAGVACISDELYYYVQRPGSIMSEKYSIRRLDVVEALLDRVEFLAERQCLDGVFQYYRITQLVLRAGYEKLDTKDPAVKERLSQLKKRLGSLYGKTPKSLSDWKDILKIRFFLISPELYVRCFNLKNKYMRSRT